MLSSTIKTDNLELVLAAQENLVVLDKIYEEAVAYYDFDSGYEITSPKVGLHQGAFPSSNLKSDYCLYCIYHSGHMIGYLELYLGLPVADNIYISFFYITKPYKDKGYEQEILANLFNLFSSTNYKTVRVSVSLKDWKGLEFWHSSGFDTIISVDTDHVFSLENYGRIELQYLI